MDLKNDKCGTLASGFENAGRAFVMNLKHSDFLSGLPVTPVTTNDLNSIEPLSPADRLRLVYTYITSTPADGGLGISPDSAEWDLVESILPLHDRQFDEAWVRSWTPKNIVTAAVQLEKIREQFGDSVAYYFAFLGSYTRFLLFPAGLGLVAYYFLPPYSPIYSLLLCLWSIFFVEWWRVRERILSLRFGTRGSFKVEKRRAQYKPGGAWWARELKVLASIPVIAVFAGVLVALLTGIFVFEAFVTQLYQGPGKQFISFAPTVLFITLVPRFMAIYQFLAKKLTKWENHAHRSSYNSSLTLKTFALSALVAYLGLGLSAFVYVPFGEGVMRTVQSWIFKGAVETHGLGAKLRTMLNGTSIDTSALPDATAFKGQTPAVNLGTTGKLFDVNAVDVRKKLNPRRLRDQMFAYTVTNQIVNTFLEVGLPYVMRAIQSFRTKRSISSPGAPGGEKKSELRKRVVFEDEKERGGMEERAFLDHVRAEVALPEYDLFADYSEMVVQFGYVVLWSTIWPLAGAMALLNNLLELRSDAFKITVHNRRPIPARTDTIGPWLDAMAFLTWLGALTNSALVYLFSPQLLAFTASNAATAFANATFTNTASPSNSTLVAEEHLVAAAGGEGVKASWGVDGTNPGTFGATRELLIKALLISLAASHGYILVRALVRHIVERVWWRGSTEVKEREEEERRVKERFLSGFVEEGKGVPTVQKVNRTVKTEGVDILGFWEHDEGLEEIQRIVKEA
ncbi:calcium-activated chloride channel-domain-containing protein [Crucibulum laeve]|uniref:Calcium-activated chloride channel-domain-containing protein n=1 Tax=Crucibulum laeve TaxID=68775 RepID=A0A5C3M5B8_9AGAR|nr:calcium-activated chloride channel-domain-containing protein [Crucibulum laeve]